MADPITDFAKLSPEKRYALAKNYSDRLLYALTEEGQLGGGRGTLEEEIESIAKELQRIGSSDFVDLIDEEIKKTEPRGLRKVLIEDYSLDAEDAILNAFGYPTEDVIGKSLQESQASNPSKSDYSKFGPGGTIPSNEFSPEEAVVADEGIGSGKIDPRDQEKFLEPGAVDIAKPNEGEEPELNLDAPAPVESEGNPYLFGTEGNQSQIANLSDIGNGKVAMPNRSDRRSMARFNNDVKSKEFALNAAQRKAREIESLEKGRRDKVSLTEPAMKQWIKANPKSRAAKLALDADGNVDLSKISDTEKIQFVRALNLGKINLDEPAAAAPQAPAAPAPQAPAPQAPMAPAPAPQAPMAQATAPEPAPVSREAAAANAFYDNAVKRAAILEDPAAAAAAANAFYDNAVKRAQDRQQMINADRLASQAESAPRPNQEPAPTPTVHHKFKNDRLATLNAPSVHDVMRKKNYMTQPPPGMPVEMTANERFPKQPNLDEPLSALPPQDPFKSKPAYTAENAQQDYNEIKSMRDLDEAKRINQLNSQIQLTNMQKSKAQNIADTKAYHNQTAPTYGKRNDGTYGLMHDPRSPQAMKERSVVMQGINNSKSGDTFQDIMDSSEEEDERKRRQQQFVSASKNSPYYTNYFGS